MAGRPQLRIGQHGKIRRTPLAPGVWVARCRYRDHDGITRVVERRGPNGDQHGKKAEDALLAHLNTRRPPGVSGDISLDTRLAELVAQHLDALERNKRSPATMTTYRSTERAMKKYTQLRVGDATPGRLNAVLTTLKHEHGANIARHARTILRGALQIAVLDDVLDANPVAQVSRIESDDAPKGAPALDGLGLRTLLAQLRESQTCRDKDLIDPITILIATGLRRSELLALLWTDFNEKIGTLTASGKLVRESGKGLKRISKGKSRSATRTVALPGFAVAALLDRRDNSEDWRGELPMIFPSTSGTYRDPDNFNKQWRKVRDDLGVPDVTSHSFRKSMATAIDDAGLSARIGADQLGHSKVSMTQDTYMKRGKTHAVVADLMDRLMADS